MMSNKVYRLYGMRNILNNVFGSGETAIDRLPISLHFRIEDTSSSRLLQRDSDVQTLLT
jgi:hypothetical protein